MSKIFKKNVLKSRLDSELITLDEARKNAEPGTETYDRLSKRIDELTKLYMEVDRVKNDKTKIILDTCRIVIDGVTLVVSVWAFKTLLLFDASETFTTTAGKDTCKNIATKFIRR